MQKVNGKFIVLEGIDGCGKDTQQKLLENFVSENKSLGEFVFVHVLNENKNHTNNLRTALFKSNFKWNTMSEMLMFWADKFETILEIQKNIQEGKNVIMNRWELSNLAYQIYAKGKKEYEEFARLMQKKLDDILKPDLHILFDISVSESSKRRALRTGQEGGNVTDNYYDQEKKDFFEKVILGYKKEIQNYNHIIIDGEQSKEKVFQDTLEAIQKTLKD